VHLLRRLTQRSRDVAIFCNVSAASLASPTFFKDVAALLDDNRGFSELMVFELSQQAVRGLGPVEFEALAALAEMGLRFSIDQVADLRGNFGHLQARGFRYVKIAADLLLDPAAPLGSDIHPADLASHFARHGLDLIVDRVEAETQVVDLLDYGLKFGQGFVFSPPRPVRNEMVQAAEPPTGAAERVGAGPERRTAIGRAIASRQ
jgi:cyclic-di-GMP phosphodiesterase TipF (flagellum assembly factor)